MYKAVVRRTLNNGTTLASYFATNHKDSSIILAEEAIRCGQRALVGKVCSNRFSPDFYVENTADSLRDTEKFIKRLIALNNPLVKPIVTPRFALSCNAELMSGLGELAAKYNLHIQSHISENIGEVELVQSVFDGRLYAGVYEDHKLLTKKCVLAHGVHLTDAELEILRKNETAIAHCPTSNTNLRSGLCDVQRLQRAGIKVGLGTDVSGGSSATMLQALRDTLNVSHHLNIVKKQFIFGSGHLQQRDADYNKNYEPFDYKQALYLATLGGAEALALDDVCGNFAVGKDFDGLLVDISVEPLDTFTLPENAQKTGNSQSRFEKMLQKFLYVGDDRNILNVFVAGKQVKN